MVDIAKTKEEMEYALQTGWDRDAAIRHGLEAIKQLEAKLTIAIDDLSVYNDCRTCDQHCGGCSYELKTSMPCGYGWKWRCEV